MKHKDEELTATLEKARRRLKCINMHTKDKLSLVGQEQTSLHQKKNLMTSCESFLKEDASLKKVEALKTH